MKELISIIVPVYNTDKSLLEKCVSSLINQTYKNIEIILVDDGSQISTADLCDKIGLTDSRIKVVHKQNGGLSSARNAGLDIAGGNLISFVDSDDYLHHDAINSLYQAYCVGMTPIVCMQSTIIDDSGRVLYHFGQDTSNIDIIDWKNYIDGICHKKLSESVCDKLFEAQLFKTQRFQSGRLNEDFLFLAKMLMDKIDVTTIDFAGYYYLKHEGTITSHNSDFTSLKDAVRNSFELAEMCEKECPEVFLSFVYSSLFQAKVLMTLLPINQIGTDEWNNCKEIIDKYIHLDKKCGIGNFDRLFLRSLLSFSRLTKTLYGFVKK